MDKDLFLKDIPGRLVKIRVHDGEDWAFIPNCLPKNINFSEKVWRLLVKAKEELGRLDGIGRHMPNYELLLKPLQHREALKSSSLEGTYATPEELLLFEVSRGRPRTSYDQLSAWQEVSNYKKALRRGQELLQSIPVSLRLIRELHKVLLSQVRGHHRAPGEFRRVQVHIGSDRRFIPPPPEEMMGALYELEKYIHSETEIDPLIFCFLVHYQFEAIHPFWDGNGRVGRLLLSLMIYKWCNLTSPWLYLSAFFDRYKNEYINKLFNISAQGDWENWIIYCLRGTIYQAKDAIKRFDKLVELKAKYSDLVAHSKGNIRLQKVVESLFEAPVVSIPDIARMCNVTYPTAKRDVDLLVGEKILSESGLPYYPRLFLANEIIDIAYKDEETEEGRDTY